MSQAAPAENRRRDCAGGRAQSEPDGREIAPHVSPSPVHERSQTGTWVSIVAPRATGTALAGGTRVQLNGVGGADQVVTSLESGYLNRRRTASKKAKD